MPDVPSKTGVDGAVLRALISVHTGVVPDEPGITPNEITYLELLSNGDARARSFWESDLEFADRVREVNELLSPEENEAVDA